MKVTIEEYLLYDSQRNHVWIAIRDIIKSFIDAGEIARNREVDEAMKEQHKICMKPIYILYYLHKFRVLYPEYEEYFEVHKSKVGLGLTQEHYRGPHNIPNIPCIWRDAYMEVCGKPVKGNSKFCEEHIGRKCSVCGDVAVRECRYVKTYRCGMFLCMRTKCYTRHSFHDGYSWSNRRYRPRKKKRRIII